MGRIGAPPAHADGAALTGDPAPVLNRSMRRRVWLTGAAVCLASAVLPGCAPGGMFGPDPGEGFARRRPRAAECFDDPTAVALAEAVQAGQVDVLRERHAEGADLAVRGLEGVSLLDWASRYGRLESLRVLLDLGVDPDLPGWQERRASHVCVAEEAAEPLTLLLEAGADPDSRAPQGFRDPLLFGAVLADHPCLEPLLAHGADVHATNDEGRTILFGACTINNFALALRMLGLGVDPRARDRRGDTFQTYLFSTPEDVLNDQARAGRAAVVAWLREHDVPLER